RLTDLFTDYASVLDTTRGPLRTTSDGNLIAEVSGDWLVLATPPHSADDRELALLKKPQPATKLPTLWMPECKNGATAFDNPRTRKPLARLLRNKWTGSDRPPA
ncbi:Atrophin-1 multi-domain protein, partial [Pyrenophora tritici-repentis]